jgi:ribosome biogenesis GTPase A
LRNSINLDGHTSEQLEELLSWFRSNLTVPAKFSRSKSKSLKNKSTSGLSWFKEDALEAIGRSYELINLLSENGYAIEIIRTGRVGYVVYEDEQQVVAEPYSDTPV